MRSWKITVLFSSNDKIFVETVVRLPSYSRKHLTYIMKQVGLVYYVMRLTCIKKQPVSWNRLVPNLLRHINDLYQKNDLYHEMRKV